DISDIEKADIAVEAGCEYMRQSERHARLADAPRPHDGHEPMFKQLSGEGFQNLVTTHQPTRARRQGARRPGRRISGRSSGKSRNRGNKAVALAGDIGDVAAFAQRFAQRVDLKSQAAFFDNI